MAEAVDTEVRTSQGTCPKTVLVKVVAGENKLDLLKYFIEDLKIFHGFWKRGRENEHHRPETLCSFGNGAS